MCTKSQKVTYKIVALLAEGVDRNVYSPIEKEEEEVSPSSRRAWIEIDVMR